MPRMKDRKPRGAPARTASPSTSTIPGLSWILAPLALGAFAWFAYQASGLWLTYPTPWPDEALFTDVSVNLIRHGRFATDLYADFFPAMRQHYYLTPPLYHLVLAGWLGVFGVSLGAVRALSAITALAVLLVTYAIGRRLGLSHLLALGPSALLALDSVFLRGALLGRMDLLALLFLLLAIWLALGDSGGSARGIGSPSTRGFFLGLASAFAVLAHPVGIVAMAVAVGWTVMARPSGRVLLPLALGMALGLLPWLVYAAQDFPSFLAQIGGQLERKGSRESILSCLSIESAQWGVNAWLVWIAWLAGLGGLGLASSRRRWVPILMGAQALVTLAVVTSCEIWYPVYVLPLTYLGFGCAWSALGRPGHRRLAAFAVAAVALIFAQQNMNRVSKLRSQRDAFDVSAQYSEWCRTIGDFLPNGSRVLTDLLPTPYFGLTSRQDLALRLFPPSGFKRSAADSAAFVNGLDYVISGRSLASPQLQSFLMSHGRIVAEIGDRAGPGYYAAVIRVHH